LIKGKYKKNANKFLVGEMFYPEYPHQPKLLNTIKHPKYLIVLSEPTLETMYKLSHFIKN